MLKLGNKNISKFYFGNKGIGKAYLGDKLMFQANKPIFVEYIESDGNQYIDTGILSSYDYTVKVKYAYTAFKSSYNCIFGARDQASTTGNRIYWVGCNNNTKELMMRMGKVASTYTINLNEVYELIISPNETTINGTSLGDAMYDGEIDFSKNIRLFTINSTDTSSFVASARLYYFQIFDKDMNLIQDLRPCIHPKTFEACMYDMVSKQYLYNQGTGEFIPAPRFVEYIQSTGTQWIDTGIKGTDITRFVVKGTCVENGVNNTQLLGGTNSSSQTFFGNRYSNNVAKWYCVDSKGASIGNPHNLSIIDATIESSTSQYGTLTDVVEGTVSEFIKFSGNAWGFPESNLLIFGGYSSRRSPNATCYLVQLYTADGLVRDLRPCIDPKGVICMYDMITKQYLYNQGTDEFIAGPKINFVDYIIFDGESWIDIDYIPSSNTRVVGKVSFTQWHPTSGANYVFGVYGDSANFGFNVGSNREVMNVPWGNSAGVTFSNTNTFGQVYSFDISKNGTYLDGVLKLTASQLSAEFTATKSFYVGWSNGTSTQKLVGNIYPMQIYENDVLEKDLRPCIINDVAGLYDMVTGKFHINIGTGTLKSSADL